MTRAAIAAVLSAVLGTGCSAELLSNANGPGTPWNDSKGQNGQNGNDGPVTCTPGEMVLGSAPMRRLSNVEYTNTLRDLVPQVAIELPELPADTITAGFENDANALGPSDLRVERWEDVAFRYGRALSEARGPLAGLAPCTESVSGAAAELACGEEIVRNFGLRAFRRPLTQDEVSRYVGLFEQQRTAIDFMGAVQLTVAAFLQAPEFLYRIETSEGALGPYEVAARLSYFFWQSLPDNSLFDAARDNRLGTDEDIEAQARRMLEDPRARVAVVDFHRQWLDFDRIEDEEHRNRVPSLYPTWNDATRSAVNEEQRRFVESTVFEGEGTLASLLTSRTTEVNASLASLYGVQGPANDATWVSAELPEGERAGILTRAGFLASHSHAANGSPPLRGVFVMERLLCVPRPSPPANANLAPPMAAPGEGPRTNRDLFEERSAPAQCQACHARIDAYGFGFENYDAVGGFRETDSGLPVDASGNLIGTDVDGPYVGAVELSDALSESETVRDCAVRNWVRFAVGRAPERADRCWMNNLADRFSETGGDIRDLMVAVASSPEFRTRANQEESR